jgi:L-2-hydroxyglutarate oxidase LhgO
MTFLILIPFINVLGEIYYTNQYSRGMESFDFLVAGGGILGISIGIEVLKKNPRARVLIVEKESFVGAHASGRNSGVLHAGFYYSADSLKARFCADGNLALREIIKKKNLPINECGKVVVASSETELGELEKLHSRGLHNGVEQQILSADQLNNYEPLAKTYKYFLWSPNTAVSDPELLLSVLEEEFRELGGVIRINSHLDVRDGDCFVNNVKISASHVVNAAGTGAISIAHSLGLGKKYSQLPVLGLYKITKSKLMPLKRLIYPVPNPEYPFLGVHFTLTVNGDIKIGPTAIPVLGAEQYKWHEGVSQSQLYETFRSIGSLLKADPALLFNLAKEELPKISTRVLLKDAEKLVPGITRVKDWDYKRPGIRAQLIDTELGKFQMDFVVENEGKFTHILNAVSPGWTASIPFAKYIVEKYLR